MSSEKTKAGGIPWLHPAIVIPVMVILAVVAAVAGVKSVQDARQQDRHTLANRQLAWAVSSIAPGLPIQDAFRAGEDALRAGADPNARFPRWQYEDLLGGEPPTLTPHALPKYDDYWQDPLPILMMASADAVKPLVAAGADVNARDAYGQTPLLFAAEDGRVTDGDCPGCDPTAMLDALLQAGADARARDRDGNTVLHLLRFDPDSFVIDRRKGDSVTTIPDSRKALAALSSLIERLVQHGADVRAKNNTGQTVLEALEEQCAGEPGAKPAFDAALARLVARLGATQGTPAAAQGTPAAAPVTAWVPVPPETDPAPPAQHRAAETCLLAWAVRHDNISAALAAVKSGGDPHTCFSNADYETFSTDDTPKIIPLPAPPKDEDDSGFYPIFFLAGPAMLEALAHAGVDINARDPAGDTALLFQASGGETDLLGSPMSDDRVFDAAKIFGLVQAGADVNARDKDGDTPLHLLPHCYHTDYYGGDDSQAMAAVIRLLIRHGADVNARNGEGQTPRYVMEDMLGKPLTASARTVLAALPPSGDGTTGSRRRGRGDRGHRR